MKDERLIRAMYEELSNDAEAFDNARDSFQFGMWVGKVVALGWALGEDPTGQIRSHQDFEDWTQEMRTLGDDLRDGLGDGE